MSLVIVDWNCDSKNMTQNEFQERLTYIICVYYVIIVALAVINILANGFSFHIFRQKIWKKSLISILLKGLSLFEILFHIAVFLHGFLELINSNIDPLPNMTFAFTFNYFLKTVNLMMLTFQMARNWTVVLLAAYRYEVICRPLSTTKVFTSTFMVKVLLIPLLVSFALSIPRFFESRVIICAGNWRKADTSPIFQSNSWYNYGYIGVIMFLSQSGGPVISVCVLSFFVLRVIWKRRQFRKNQNIPERSAPTGDKLVLLLCATFFVFETPAFFSKILYYPLKLNNYVLANIYLGLTCNILIYLDSTINMFVYMASNPTYREATASQLKKIGIDISKWRYNENIEATDADELMSLRPKNIENDKC